MMNKGILYKIFIIPLLLIPLVCPFHISADTVIVPTYASNSTQTEFQNIGGTVQNFCDSALSGGVPCKLTFTFNDAYYGMIYFDASFGSNSTQTFQTVYITNGVGEWNYKTISNSPYQVTAVKIQIINLSTNKDDEKIMWTFPIESYSPVYYSANQGFEVTDFYGIGYYKYPIFISNTTGYVYRLRQSEPITVIIGSTASIYNTSTFSNYFSYTGTLSNFKTLSAVSGFYLFSVEITGEYAQFLDLKWKTSNILFTPIYINYTSNRYLSNDFALQFGLKNNYLENVESIANGTNSSNTSAGNLETVSDDISSSSDDLIQSENSFNNSMNSNLQQIDTNINIGNLGSKFLASAEWVRVQFNTLTNGTPFGSVLSFSLLLGLALVLVGRIRK